MGRIKDLPTVITASDITNDAQSHVCVDMESPNQTGRMTVGELKHLGVEVVNVKQHGALGDNSNDDTAEIQAACDAAVAASPVGTTGSRPVVYLPPGRYIISDTIDIQDNISFIGSGRDSTIIKFQPSAGSKPALKMADATPYHKFGLIQDLTIQVPNTVTHDVLTGIYIQEATRTVVSRVFVNMDGLSSKDHVGIEIDGQEQIRVEDCSFLCPVGIYISSNLDNSSFRNITYLSDSTGGSGAPATYPFAAIYVDGSAQLNRCVWDGHQTVVKKEHAFYYVNASGATAHGCALHNIRTEAGPTSSEYEIVCNGANVVRHLQLHNCRFQSTQKGINCNNVDSLLVTGTRFEAGSTESLYWRGTGHFEFDDSCTYATGCTADISGSYQGLTLTGLRGSKTWPTVWFSGITSPAISKNFLRYRTANATPTTITTFNVVNGPVAGQVYVIDVNDGNTTFDHSGTGSAGTMTLAGAADFAPASGGTIVLLYNGTFFKEVSRTSF